MYLYTVDNREANRLLLYSLHDLYSTYYPTFENIPLKTEG